MSSYTINVSPGATFNDIHDNENVYLTVADGKTLLGKEQELNIEESAEAEEKDSVTMKTSEELEELLKGYFKPLFLGIGGAGINQLEKLVTDIQGLSGSAKDMAAVALMMYVSPYFRPRHRTFTKWYETFCHIVGCAKLDNCRPSRIAPPDELARSFGYLQK